MTTSTGDISAVLASLRASLLCGLERAVELAPIGSVLPCAPRSPGCVALPGRCRLRIHSGDLAIAALDRELSDELLHPRLLVAIGV